MVLELYICECGRVTDIPDTWGDVDFCEDCRQVDSFEYVEIDLCKQCHHSTNTDEFCPKCMEKYNAYLEY